MGSFDSDHSKEEPLIQQCKKYFCHMWLHIPAELSCCGEELLYLAALCCSIQLKQA